MNDHPSMVEALDLMRTALGMLAEASATSRAPDGEPLVDAAQLAAALNLPQTWIEQAAREGTIPHYKAGRWVRFSRREVEASLRVARTDAGRAK